MSEEEALIAAVCAAPDDDLPRLVYADYLEEHDRPERAEFIRVQCELARLDPLKCWHPEGSTSDCPQCGALRRRERELWANGVRGAFVGVPGGWIVAVTGEAPGGWDRLAEFRRGFVEEVNCPAADWIANADAIRKTQPVRKVRLTRGFTDRAQLAEVMERAARNGFCFPNPVPHVTGAMDVFGWAYPGVEFELVPEPNFIRVGFRDIRVGFRDGRLRAGGQEVTPPDLT